ncbi:hypothetical protein [Tenacibaculum xiamenense]|uniref:hypothetical protein n=1 Tax=Tenacibaculum xiamenense TaxID=1261553 RepID=UPI003893618C
MNTLNINNIPYIDPDVYKIAIIIFLIIIFMMFILSILRKILDHKLKSKIIDKGIPQETISEILQTSNKTEGHNNIKWFLILMGIGIGLFVVKQFPLGLHSIGIMAVFIALSFLAFAQYLKRFNN